MTGYTKMKKTRIILPVLLLCVALITCVCFSGCLSSDYNDLVTKLQGEDYGYNVRAYTVDQMLNNDITGLQARVQASKMDGTEVEYVTVWYFSTEEYAIRWYEEDETGFLKYGLSTIVGPANAEEAESGEFSASADVAYSRQGKVVICGTADAYADAMS